MPRCQALRYRMLRRKLTTSCEVTTEVSISFQSRTSQLCSQVPLTSVSLGCSYSVSAVEARGLRVRFAPSSPSAAVFLGRRGRDGRFAFTSSSGLLQAEIRRRAHPPALARNHPSSGRHRPRTDQRESLHAFHRSRRGRAGLRRHVLG
jgi:hypothetical protein